MSVVSVKQALSGTIAAGTRVSVRGWVRTRRDSKAGLSFVNVSDGSCFDPIQIVAPADLANYESEVKKLTAGCAVIATGKLVESQGQGQGFELQASHVVLGQRPVLVVKEADAGALAESRLGSLRGASSALYVYASHTTDSLSATNRNRSIRAASDSTVLRSCTSGAAATSRGRRSSPSVSVSTGVVPAGLPYAPSVSARCWSVMRKRMFLASVTALPLP